jgi:hypothetical protein
MESALQALLPIDPTDFKQENLAWHELEPTVDASWHDKSP